MHSVSYFTAPLPRLATLNFGNPWFSPVASQSLRLNYSVVYCINIYNLNILLTANTIIIIIIIISVILLLFLLLLIIGITRYAAATAAMFVGTF